MRKLLAVSVVALFAAGPAFAQSTSMQSANMPSGSTPYTSGAQPYVAGPQPMRPPPGGWPKPVDHGPFTAQANAAYAGGGMILQGAPGAPAPLPQPNMAPQ
jgi:hypothetical protein